MPHSRLHMNLFSRLLWTLVTACIAWQLGLGAREESLLGDVYRQLNSLTASDPAATSKDEQETLAVLQQRNPLRRFWSCANQTARQRRKFVFLHIPKTAGSTLRRLMEHYGKACGAGVASSNGCPDLSWETISQEDHTTGFVNGKGQTCRVGRTVDRSTKGSLHTEDLSYSFLKNQVDLLAGHLPLGLDAFWTDHSGAVVETQYLIFFRDPAARFVSLQIYTEERIGRSPTVDQIVEKIKAKVLRIRAEGKYSNAYSSQLLHFPLPLEKRLSGNLDDAGKVEVILRHLVEHNVIVGVAEHYSNSLAMVHFAMDEFNEQEELFVRYGMGAADKGVKANTSTLSTSLVLAVLKDDDTFWPQFLDYLKYEKLLYEGALKIHEKQYQWLLQYTRK